MFASVDVGASITSCAVATGAGQMVAERTIPTLAHEGPDAVSPGLPRPSTRWPPAPTSVSLALGLGVPGLADFHRGRTLFLPNLPTQWRNLPVAEQLSARVNCPVFVLNDARMAALGELWFGHGRTARTMVVFTVGTGIGGGVVIERKLRLGPLGAAGEIGHLTIQADGPLCGCGNRGCLETLASSPALIGEGTRLMKSGHAPHLYDMVEADANRITPRLLAQAAAAGDTSVREAVVRAARFLGIGVANVIAVIHPELVVLGRRSGRHRPAAHRNRAPRGTRACAPVPRRERAYRRLRAPGQGRPVGRRCAGHRPRQAGSRSAFHARASRPRPIGTDGLLERRRRRHRLFSPPMAGVAGDGSLAPRKPGVDIEHHRLHHARGDLLGVVVAGAVALDVAETAFHAEACLVGRMAGMRSSCFRTFRFFGT